MDENDLERRVAALEQFIAETTQPAAEVIAANATVIALVAARLVPEVVSKEGLLAYVTAAANTVEVRYGPAGRSILSAFRTALTEALAAPPRNDTPRS